jgi:hypothetical protein
MKLRKPLIITAIALTSLVASGATPASAEDTIATFSLAAAGGLTLTVQAGPMALTNGVSGETVITGSLGLVEVTDENGGTTNWTVSATASAFIGALGLPSSSTAVFYNAGVVTETGTITVADGVATDITGAPANVVMPTSLSGNNGASWTPTLTITMPAGALVDDYTGTVTTSIV